MRIASETTRLCSVTSVAHRSALSLFMWTPALSAGAGYHDGFTIPAGATNIQITEEPYNSNVYLGECMLKWRPIYWIAWSGLLTHNIYVLHCLSSSRPPAAAVTTGADPPLNGGYGVGTSAAFHAGRAVWTYSSGTVDERLECPGPLSTSVHIQVKGIEHMRGLK